MLTITFINKLKNTFKRFKEIEFYYNKNILECLELFRFNGWLDFHLELDTKRKKGKLTLTKCTIKDIKLVSKPSRVVIKNYRQLIPIRENCILSTSQGLMTKEESYQRKIGGIVLMKIIL